jgi:Domain of unknown function (DUF4291)
MTKSATRQPPLRQVRAVFDERTLTVYQAYPPRIADAALAANTLVPPFKFDRMTWIKPSFLWMMYRSGWATKPGQERVLAIRISRTGFEQALGDACLSSYDPDVYASYDDWLRRKQTSPIRVQWDPERSLQLAPLAWRTVQIGLSGAAVHRYVSEWITGVTDITPTVHDLRSLLAQDAQAAAAGNLPVEKPYPLPVAAAQAVGATQLT